MPRDSKVIIWRPFPSPSGKRKLQSVLPLLAPARLTTTKPKTQMESDQDVVEHWIRLADLGTDSVPNTKKKLG
jgi:hypothetical protein